MEHVILTLTIGLLGVTLGCDKPELSKCYRAFNTQVPQANWSAQAKNIHDAYCSGLVSARMCVVDPIQGCDAAEVRKWKAMQLSAEYACQPERANMDIQFIACRGDKPELKQKEDSCKATHLTPLAGTPSNAEACKALQDNLRCICDVYHACAKDSWDFICEKMKESMRPTADLYKCELSTTTDDGTTDDGNGAMCLYTAQTTLLFSVILSLVFLV